MKHFFAVLLWKLSEFFYFSLTIHSLINPNLAYLDISLFAQTLIEDLAVLRGDTLPETEIGTVQLQGPMYDTVNYSPLLKNILSNQKLSKIMSPHEKLLSKVLKLCEENQQLNQC